MDSAACGSTVLTESGTLSARVMNQPSPDLQICMETVNTNKENRSDEVNGQAALQTMEIETAAAADARTIFKQVHRFKMWANAKKKLLYIMICRLVALVILLILLLIFHSTCSTVPSTSSSSFISFYIISHFVLSIYHIDIDQIDLSYHIFNLSNIKNQIKSFSMSSM